MKFDYIYNTLIYFSHFQCSLDISDFDEDTMKEVARTSSPKLEICSPNTYKSRIDSIGAFNIYFLNIRYF